jgi:hypothetical protein
MSPTLRQVIHEQFTDRKRVKFTYGTNFTNFHHFSEDDCANQKRFFDLRRELMMNDDTTRLHLGELNEMLSPKNKPVADEPKVRLLPSVDLSSISKST